MDGLLATSVYEGDSASPNAVAAARRTAHFTIDNLLIYIDFKEAYCREWYSQPVRFGFGRAPSTEFPLENRTGGLVGLGVRISGQEVQSSPEPFLKTLPRAVEVHS